MEVTRVLAIKFLRAIVVAEYSLKSALQLTHTTAVSGEFALQREQVCKRDLQMNFSLFYSLALSLQSGLH
jgi:hypothetical protein